MDRPAGYGAFKKMLVGAVDQRTGQLKGGMPSEHLRSLAESVGGLLDHPGWKVVRGVAGDKIEELTQKQRHRPMSHLDYAWQNGIASGLEQVLCLPEVVLHAALERRELEERLADEREAREAVGG